MNRLQITVMLVLLTVYGVAGEDDTVFRAIREGDPARVQVVLTKANIEARDPRGSTPLMYAAAFGNLATFKILLEAGADVNARNDSGVTALHWAARSEEKARLLLSRGADPSARTRQGGTPLMTACSRVGGSAVVALMLAKGADAKVTDTLGVSAIAIAARAGDVEIVRMLLAKGADPNTGFAGRTALLGATLGENADVVHLLLHSGADVHASTILPAGAATRTMNNIKNGPPNGSGVTALHNAAANGPVESIRYLLKAGADVNARDSRGMTPLFFALATEYPSVEIVRALLKSGADPNVRDTTGQSPLDWAGKFGYANVLSELKRAGAKAGLKYEALHPPVAPPAQPRVALERSVKLLESTSATFFKGSGCVSCHHQNLITRAQSLAKAAGIAIDEKLVAEQALQMRAQWIPMQDAFLQGILPGGGANRVALNLLGLKAADFLPDSVTDAAMTGMAEAQDPDGAWGSDEVQHRPPIAQSRFASTARVLRALQDYAIPARKQEFARRVALAKEWLMTAKPLTTEDYTMRLSGLKYAGASERDVRNAAKALVALQRQNGGWSGNPHMQSDAYATGRALVALIESNALSSNDPHYRRGIDFLMSTQFPDASWYVRSRSIKFQPYFESGFPFAHDQWISAAATAWAAQAIAIGLKPASIVASGR